MIGLPRPRPTRTPTPGWSSPAATSAPHRAAAPTKSWPASSSELLLDFAVVLGAGTNAFRTTRLERLALLPQVSPGSGVTSSRSSSNVARGRAPAEGGVPPAAPARRVLLEDRALASLGQILRPATQRARLGLVEEERVRDGAVVRQTRPSPQALPGPAGLRPVGLGPEEGNVEQIAQTLDRPVRPGRARRRREGASPARARGRRPSGRGGTAPSRSSAAGGASSHGGQLGRTCTSTSTGRPGQASGSSCGARPYSSWSPASTKPAARGRLVRQLVGHVEVEVARDPSGRLRVERSQLGPLTTRSGPSTAARARVRWALAASAKAAPRCPTSGGRANGSSR